MDRLLRSTRLLEAYVSNRRQKIMWLYIYSILFISLCLFQNSISQALKTHFWHQYLLKTPDCLLHFDYAMATLSFFYPSRLKSFPFWIFKLAISFFWNIPPTGLPIVDLTTFRFQLILAKLREASLLSLADQELSTQALSNCLI